MKTALKFLGPLGIVLILVAGPFINSSAHAVSLATAEELGNVRGMDDDDSMHECFGKCFRKLEGCFANYTPKGCNPYPNPDPNPLLEPGSTLCYGENGDLGQLELLAEDYEESKCEPAGSNRLATCSDAEWDGCEVYNVYRCVNLTNRTWQTVNGVPVRLISYRTDCTQGEQINVLYKGTYWDAVGTECTD
ncbi:MAG: hypothetical protein AAGK14_02890 [Verrucomicrobiota bacterium]